MLTSLMLSGTLFLSVSTPVYLSQRENNFWISQKDIIRVRNFKNNVIIEAQKKGVVYIHGLEKPANATQRVVVVSDKNLEALQRCPQARILWEQPEGRVENAQDLLSFKNCGFDDLSISDREYSKLEETLKLKEAQLFSLGLLMHRAYWKNGQKYIEVNKDSWEQFLPQIRNVLNENLPIYKWIPLKGAQPGRTLLFELTLFEYSKNKARQLGLHWPTHIPLYALQGKMPPQSTDNLIIYSDFGESQGVGKIIAQPQLRCKPGEKAIFQSGGELPVTQSNAYQSKTEWKSYGLKLEIEPSADIVTGASEVALSFSLEASEPDLSTAISGIPGLSTKKLQSRFDLRTQELTILSTLLQKKSGKTREGLSFLSHIPILSYLFSKENSLSQESELWFAIKSSWEDPKVKSPEDYKVSYEF